ncbi:ESPR-type extended signal peptide-containing protein, partial [Haemophilus parahaemolyticus]
MNKIFRVVWSQATQSWVVVSELTKAHKKQSSSNAQKSAVTFSGNFIKSSAIALSLLSGSAAYAAETVANGLIQINSTGTATATGSDSIAIGKDSKASGNNNSLAIGHSAQATGNDGALAIGGDSKASGKSNIALGYLAKADKDFAVAIGRGASAQQFNNAVAIGANSQANGATSLALGMGSKATGHDSYAIGYGSDAIGEQSIAFGRQSKASNKYDIVFGAEAGTRDKGQGYSIAIGVGAMSGTQSAGKNLNGGDAGGVAIGTGAYTGVNQSDERPVNSSVAIGAGAGAGYRAITNGLPTGVATDADNNNVVLVKAFGGTTSKLDYFKSTGDANKDGFFSFQNVNINEATALGRNARAIGDQSVAIGAQSVAGQGSIVIGGNDIQAYDKKKYFKAADPNSKDATGVNDFNAAVTPGTGKKNAKDKAESVLTISEKYKELVGVGLDNSYRSSYGQDGSTVIGMQAHSTTPLGVAIGTNSIVRKGAFGATAIGSGASVLANAEAAVAIGMGSEAQGNYAVAAGTAARAEKAAVAAGYSAKAKESAVAVGDHSNAVEASVAVGQGAKAEQVADIAIGQGAVASGEQGAIAMGLGTIAQGHSSIMIGGADISTAAKQVVKYSKEKIREDGTPELDDETITEVINGKTVKRNVKIVQTEMVTGKKLSDAYREITGYNLDIDSLNYGSSDNKNGHASISMGIHSLSKGAMGVAIGTAARADALGSMALGTGAHASMQNSVAIGTGAVADKVSKGTRQTDISYDEDGNVVETGSLKAKYTFRWAGGINTSEGDVVSFGTPGAERQLKNVAAGRVAQDSTDAVNGSQLNAITRSLSQTITNGWQVGGNNKFRMSNIGSNERVNFLDGLGTSVNIAEINQAEDIDGNKLVKIGSDFYKADDFTNGKLNADAKKVADEEIKKQPAGANVTFDVKEVNSTLSVTPVGLKVTTGEVTANPDGTMKTPNDTIKADNTRVTAAMNSAEKALVASQKEWREKNDAYQQTELAYLAADTALTKGKEAVGTILADIEITKQELKTAGDLLATEEDILTRAQADADRNPTDTEKQSVLLKAREKVEGAQFVVEQRKRKLAQQEATLTDRQNRVTVLEQEKTKAEAVRDTAKGDYEVANRDLTEKKEAFNTAKEAFVAAGANQIATVQNVADSINASGWTLQQGTTDKDLVHPGDKVAFADGNGTTVTVTTDAEGKRSEIKFDVDKADLTTTAGKVVAPDVKALKEAVTEAEKEATASPTDAAKQKALADAKAALAKEENKVVTAQNVAEAINNAGFNLKTSATTGGEKLKGTKDNGELIKPSNTVE